jgi:hypothetical protein
VDKLISSCYLKKIEQDNLEQFPQFEEISFFTNNKIKTFGAKVSEPLKSLAIAYFGRLREFRSRKYS